MRGGMLEPLVRRVKHTSTERETCSHTLSASGIACQELGKSSGEEPGFTEAVYSLVSLELAMVFSPFCAPPSSMWGRGGGRLLHRAFGGVCYVGRRSVLGTGSAELLRASSRKPWLLHVRLSELCSNDARPGLEKLPYDAQARLKS